MHVHKVNSFAVADNRQPFVNLLAGQEEYAQAAGIAQPGKVTEKFFYTVSVMLWIVHNQERALLLQGK